MLSVSVTVPMADIAVEVTNPGSPDLGTPGIGQCSTGTEYECNDCQKNQFFNDYITPPTFLTDYSVIQCEFLAVIKMLNKIYGKYCVHVGPDRIPPPIQ